MLLVEREGPCLVRRTRYRRHRGEAIVAGSHLPGIVAENGRRDLNHLTCRLTIASSNRPNPEIAASSGVFSASRLSTS